MVNTPEGRRKAAAARRARKARERELGIYGSNHRNDFYEHRETKGGPATPPSRITGRTQLKDIIDILPHRWGR